jgi:hypothetical protein
LSSFICIAIDELRDVGHRHLVGVSMEGVERHPGQHGVAHCRLLPQQMRRVQFTAGFIPCPPFVDHEFDAMLPVEFAHDGPVIGDQRCHLVGFGKQFVIFGVGELDRAAFAFEPVVRAALADIPRIMMRRPAPHPAKTAFFSQLAEKAPRPAQIAAIRS